MRKRGVRLVVRVSMDTMQPFVTPRATSVALTAVFNNVHLNHA